MIINDAFVDSIIEHCLLENKCLKPISEEHGTEMCNQRLLALENQMKSVLGWAEKFVKSGIDIDIFFDKEHAKETDSLYLIENSPTIAYDVQKHYLLLDKIRDKTKYLCPEIFESEEAFENSVLNCECFLMNAGLPSLVVSVDFKNQNIGRLMQNAPWQIADEFIKKFPKFKKEFEDYIEDVVIHAINQP